VDHGPDARRPLGLVGAQPDDRQLPAAAAAVVAAARAAAAPAGVKTIFQVGVLRPPLPLPDDANDVQWKVTEVHVAVAVTLCACAPAANTADSSAATAVAVQMRASLVRERSTYLAGSVDLLIAGLLRTGVLSVLPMAEAVWPPATAV